MATWTASAEQDAGQIHTLQVDDGGVVALTPYGVPHDVVWSENGPVSVFTDTTGSEVRATLVGSPGGSVPLIGAATAPTAVSVGGNLLGIAFRESDGTIQAVNVCAPAP